MKGKCPKCGQSSGVPLCLNCGNASVQVQKFLGTHTFTCNRCEMTYSYATCPFCNCQIPARAFAAPSLLVIGWIIVILVMLVVFIMKSCG